MVRPLDRFELTPEREKEKVSNQPVLDLQSQHGDGQFRLSYLTRSQSGRWFRDVSRAGWQRDSRVLEGLPMVYTVMTDSRVLEGLLWPI